MELDEEPGGVTNNGRVKTATGAWKPVTACQARVTNQLMVQFRNR
jgi:hypothetical protein